jgi:hypothetical protein
MEWLGTFGLCIALPKNKKKGNVFAISLYKQATPTGFGASVESCSQKEFTMF